MADERIKAIYECLEIVERYINIAGSDCVIYQDGVRADIEDFTVIELAMAVKIKKAIQSLLPPSPAPDKSLDIKKAYESLPREMYGSAEPQNILHQAAAPLQGHKE
jgi:hypothetical protein